MTINKIAPVALLLLAVASSASAQEGVMGVKDCMEYAVSNSTKMRIRQAETGDARIARRQAVLAAFTPEISGGIYTYYNFGRTVDPQTNTYVNTTSFHNSYNLSAGINLFNGFEAVNNMKITRTSLQMGISQERQAEADICLATMEAYYNAVYYTLLSKSYEEQCATAQEKLELTRKQEKLGVKGYADVVQSESDLAKRRYEFTNAENLRRDALITLQDVMFWPLDSVLTIDTDISADMVGVLQEDGGVEGIISYAKAYNPAAIQALGKFNNAKLELQTAKWQLLPSFALYGGWSTTYFQYPGGMSTDPFRQQFLNNGGEYVQLSINIPIYSRLSRQSNLAKKRNALERSSAEYDQKMRDIEAEVRRAVQDRDASSDAYLQAERYAEVQRENYRLNSKKYEQGLISAIEYQTATNDYLNSKAEKMNSLFKYLIKKSVVEYYSGVAYLEQEYL